MLINMGIGKQARELVREERELDILEHGLAVQRSRMLEHDAGAHARDLVRRPAGHLDAADAHRAGIGTFDTHDQLHHGGFAGAVRADQAENFPGLNAERHVLDGDKPAEALGEAFDLKMRAACGAHEGSLLRVSRPKKPLGNNSTTTSAMAKTTKFERSPSGRSASLMAMRNTAPS